jgi:hypothetical protein
LWGTGHSRDSRQAAQARIAFRPSVEREADLAAGAAALPAVSHIASAQVYPSRPVRIIVGLAAGSSLDILARRMGQLARHSYQR